MRFQIREGVSLLVWGMLSASVHAQCSVHGGGGKGLVWILPEQELPKASLKCDKIC